MIKNIAKSETEIRSLFDEKLTRLDRNTVLRHIINHASVDDSILIATTGFTGR